MSLQTLHTPVSGPVLYSLDDNPATHDWGVDNLDVDSILVDTLENVMYQKNGVNAGDWLVFGRVCEFINYFGSEYAPSMRAQGYEYAP